MEQGTLSYPKDMRLSKFAGLPCSLFSDFHDIHSFILQKQLMNAYYIQLMHLLLQGGHQCERQDSVLHGHKP